MQLQPLDIIQRAKALAEIQKQVEPLLPSGVKLLNIRENVWVLGCIPFLRTRVRFMIPELEKTLSDFAQRKIKIELKTSIPNPTPPTPTPQITKLVMSPETRERILSNAKSITDERIRQTLEAIARRV